MPTAIGLVKLLFILENYYPHIGGVEIVFKHLCEGLAAKGHKVTVLTHKLPKTVAKERINGVTIIRVPCFDSRYIFTFAAIPQAIKYAKDADLIHTTTYNGAFPAWLAALIRGKPKVMTVHETWLGKWREYSNFSTLAVWLHELLEWCVYHIPLFDKYICVSDSTKKMLMQALPERKERMLTIHNGFDDDIPTPSQQEINRLRKQYQLEGKFVLFAWGRPGTTKGFEYLVDAFPLIKKSIPNAILLLMLSKDKQYVHKVHEFKIKAHKDIIFVEPTKHDKIAPYRAIADCIVIPSVTEGFGYAVLEAVESGVPVVATNTTSIPEVIYGKYALVKPKSAKAIAEGVLSVKQGKYKTTPKKIFSWNENIKNHEELYKKIARKK